MKINFTTFVLSLAITSPFLCLPTFAQPSTDNDLQTQIIDLQKQIDALSTQQPLIKPPEKEPQFMVNGFATVAMSRSNNADYSYLKISNQNITDQTTTTADSRLGLQFTFTANEDVSFVAQVLAEAKTRWQMEATWAYVEYTFNNHWSARAGKMRLPYYLASEYIDVGYAYPWVRPPSELYSVFIDNYTGAELQHTAEFNQGWISRTKFYYGSVFDGERGDVTGDDAFDYALNNLWGFEERLSLGNFTLRASYTQGEFDLKVPGFITLDNETYQYAVLGMAYDSEGLAFSYEYAHSKIDNYSENTPYTATIGYHLDQWFPYLVFSEVDDEDQLFGDTRQKSLTLGTRLFVSEYFAVKAAVQHCYDFDGTTGQFSAVDPNANAIISDSINVYTFTIDSVF